MVQYVFTPWRDRQELLLVRHQFFASAADRTQSSRRQDGRPDASGSRPEQQHRAVARVSMWMQRGGCPHMVESTALLTAAVLSDEERDAEGRAGESAAAAATYAVRAAYSAAFSRFVTGLLDGHQDKQRKQSMYSIAKTIGLPATFVELRHQSTHEQLPSLAKLRSAAHKALAWIWDYYWKHLGDVVDGRPADPCAAAVLAYLREEGDARRRRALKELSRWERGRLLETVKELQGSLPGNQVFLKCMKLVSELKAAEAAEAHAKSTEALQGGDQPATEDMATGEQNMADVAPARTDPEPTRSSDPAPETGWSRHQGPWKPKPIGVV